MTTTKASGTVWAILGHRFAIKGADGRTLADLGSKGAGGIALRVGDDGTIRTVKPARAEAA